MSKLLASLIINVSKYISSDRQIIKNWKLAIISLSLEISIQKEQAHSKGET